MSKTPTCFFPVEPDNPPLTNLLLDSFYKFSSYLSSSFNILFMFLLIKSTQALLLSLHILLIVFIHIQIGAINRAYKHFTDQFISFQKSETTSQNFSIFLHLNKYKSFYEQTYFYIVVFIISSVLLIHY